MPPQPPKPNYEPLMRDPVFYLWHSPHPNGVEHETLCGLSEAYRIAGERHPEIDCPACLVELSN